MAGLMEEFEKGLMAMEPDSEVASDFAIGVSGSAGRVAESLEDSEATGLAMAGESVAAGNHRRKRAADSNKEHLRVAAGMKMRRAATGEAYCTSVQVSLAHWSRFE